jgi:hypothetical protein
VSEAIAENCCDMGAKMRPYLKAIAFVAMVYARCPIQISANKWLIVQIFANK